MINKLLTLIDERSNQLISDKHLFIVRTGIVESVNNDIVNVVMEDSQETYVLPNKTGGRLNIGNRVFVIGRDGLSLSQYGFIAFNETIMESASISATINEVLIEGDLDSVADLKIAGKIVNESGGEVFNDYINNNASGFRSTARGQSTTASGAYSEASGVQTTAVGLASTARGKNTTAYGVCSEASGRSYYSYDESGLSLDYWYTKPFGAAYGDYSHSEGDNCFSYGVGSHSEGRECLSYREYCHSEGQETFAWGYRSHSQGTRTLAYGNESHSGGYGSATPYDIIDYIQNVVPNAGIPLTTIWLSTPFNCAYGHYSITLGYNCLAYGDYSQAYGNGTCAGSAYQTVIGKYNIVDTEGKYAFIIGNGTDNNNRSNAYAVDWNGNLYVNGSTTSGGNISFATEDEIASLFA